MAGTIRKVAEFLGKSVSEQQVETLVAYLDIDKCRNNPRLHFTIPAPLLASEEQGHIRKGKLKSQFYF
jgi:hypothetical protein